MPTVPRLQRQVSAAALPGARLTAHETGLSTGAGVHAAEANSALQQGDATAHAYKALGGFGGVLADSGFKVADVVLREREKADRIVLLDAENRYNMATNPVVTEAMNRKGKAVLTAPEDVLGQVGTIASQIEAGLPTAKQKLAFRTSVAGKQAQVDLQVRRYTANEMDRHAGEELNAGVANDINQAVAFGASAPSGDVEKDKLTMQWAQQSIGAAVKKIETVGADLGWGEQQIIEAKLKARSAGHAGIIDAMIVDGRTKQAGAYFAAVVEEGQLSQPAQADLTKKLTAKKTSQAALDTSEELYAKLAPPADDDVTPIPLDKMETEARKKFADDPEALHLTIGMLRERKAGIDSSRRDRLEQRGGALFLQASEGAPLDTIVQMPEYLASSPGDQAKVRDYIVRRAEQAESRAATRAGREAAEENRDYTRAMRAEQTREKTGWVGYWVASDPKVLSEMNEAALHMLRPELGDEHVNRLLTQKRAMGKDEKKIIAATMDDEQFKQIAASAGLNPYGKNKDEDEQVMLGRLDVRVKTAIDAQQRKDGKPLTFEEKGAIMQRVVDVEVMQTGWSGHQRMKAAMVNPRDVDTAYVPIGEIPPADVQRFLNYAQRQNPDMTPDAVKKKFGHAIQQARARQILGVPDAEINSLFKAGQ